MDVTWVLVVATALIVVETALIVWLMRHRAAAHRARRLLRDRLLFETLLADISAKLIHATLGNTRAVDVDREIHNALRAIAEFAAVDRATIVEFSDGGDAGRSWAIGERLDHERWRWLLDRVRASKEARQGPEVAVPLRAGGRPLGAVVLVADRDGRAWPDEFMAQLRLLCEVIANALAAAKAEREAVRLRQELAHIGRVSALGELTASLAHELNQPLTAILNNAEVAQQHLDAAIIDGAKLRDILSDIVADDKRAAGVIRRLRTMLKKGEVEHVALNVNEVVRQVTDLVRNDTILRDIPVHLDLAAALPTVRGDRGQLQQVVLNMVLNGLEATSAANGRADGLVIRTSADRTNVVVAVEDSGTGIDLENVDRLFEPLYTTKAEGLGMGLSIARTIVGAHGGELRAANNRRGGATFEFTLPGAPA